MSAASATPRTASRPSGRASSAGVPEGRVTRMPGTYRTPRTPPELAAGIDGFRTSVPPVRERTVLRVAVEDAGFGQAGEAFLDGLGPGVADALDIIEILGRGPHDLVQAPEVLGDAVDDDVGQP